MSDSNTYQQLLELTAIASSNATMLKRLDRDVPNMYALIGGLTKRVSDIENARAEESGESSGRAWAFARVASVVVVAIGICSGILTALWNWLSALW